MVRTLAVLLCAAALAAAPPPVYQPTWDSLATHQNPQWLQDAKFGIYAHWGVYSVPAYEHEWYAKRMYDPNPPRSTYEHHRKTYGTQDKFGYKDFVPMFKAEKFNPDEWAEVIRQSGARYAGIAVMHHDGFALWASKANRWNATNMGPHRDLYGDLVKALRAKGLKTIATEHHMRTFNWYLPAKPFLEEARKMKFDLFDPRYADLYWNEFTSTREQFIAQWKAKLMEIIDNYRPDVLWFDGGEFQTPDVAQYVMSVLAHYYNQGGAQVDVLNKFAGTMKFNFPREFGMLTFEDGRDRPAEVDRAWIDDESIGFGSWGYVEGLKLRGVEEVVKGFVDRVSRGGGLLLSLSPMANGEIPPDQRKFLLDFGQWLKVNGEAIYGTRPWKVHAEGSTDKLIVKRAAHTGWTFERCDASDIRFTSKGDQLYAITLGWPRDGRLTIKTLAPATGTVTSVALLGSGAVKYSQSPEGLTLSLPAQRPGKYAYAFRIGLKR